MMTRPNDIPQGVWGTVCGIGASGPNAGYLNIRIARAIMAEREACAKIAEEHHNRSGYASDTDLMCDRIADDIRNRP